MLKVGMADDPVQREEEAVSQIRLLKLKVMANGAIVKCYCVN
jgi:hypothetical protein